MSYFHARHSNVEIVYFRYNVVCKKCCIYTLGTRMMGLLRASPSFCFRHFFFAGGVGSFFFLANNNTKKKHICLLCVFFFLVLVFLHVNYFLKKKSHLHVNVYFRYNVVCKKCRICTLDTRMLQLFIFVIMLFVRSVVSAIVYFVVMLFVRSVVSTRSTLG